MCVDTGGQGTWAPAKLNWTRLQDMTLGKFFPLFVAQFIHQFSRWLNQIMAKMPSSIDLEDSKNGRVDWRMYQLGAFPPHFAEDYVMGEDTEPCDSHPQKRASAQAGSGSDCGVTRGRQMPCGSLAGPCSPWGYLETSLDLA